MNQFEQFKVHRRREPSGAGVPSDVQFRLSPDDNERFFITVTDPAGHELPPDERGTSGPVYTLLRSLRSLKEKALGRFAWSGKAGTVYLDEHPFLLDLLKECPSVTDKEGKALSFQEGVYTMTAYLTRLGQHEYMPLFRPASEDSSSIGEGLMALLNEEAAIVGNRIYRFRPIGEDYLHLNLLTGPFSDEEAPVYLSILLSRFENLNLWIQGKEIVRDETPVKAQPTLVIEKVDEDQSLLLRVGQSLPGVSLSFVEDFSPSVLATLSPEGKVLLREVQYEGEEDLADLLKKELSACAPTRADARQIYSDGGFFIVPQSVAGPFLVNALLPLSRKFRMVGAEKLSAFKIKTVQPSLKLTLSSGIDFLEGDASVEVDRERFSLQDFLSEYREKNYIQLSDGNRALVDPEYVRRLERLLSRKGKGGKLRASFFDLPEISALVDQVPDCVLLRRSRSFYEGFNALGAKRLTVPGLQTELRPYQKEGVKWLQYLYENGFGACLADDMGLGKTVQAIALLCKIYPKSLRPSLLVMPKSLLFNWKAELTRFAPHLRTAVYYGSQRSFPEDAQIVLTTYALVRNDAELLSKKEFELVVLDESQHVKNLSSQVSKAVLLLKADHRIALSGTPVENNLGELYALMRFLNPAMFGSAEDFNRRYAAPVQKEHDEEAMEQLRRRIFPFLLRRLKQDVLKDLPDLTEQTLRVEMEEEHARFYEKRRAYYARSIKESVRERGINASRFELLQALSELRRIASVPESLSDGRVPSSKIPVLLEALEEGVANGHKCVVFFNFIAGIELLGEALGNAGIEYAVMTGATQDRERVVSRFQTDPRLSVLLMTLKTGGVGLNLTAADTVFVAEPWWNRSAEHQAISRLHRIGQKSAVHSFSILVEGTIEDKIRQLQEQKEDLLDNLIKADAGNSGKQLSEADIDFLFGQQA